MAVRAEQNAFRGLLTEGVEGSREPPAADLKALGPWVEVVEGERGHTSVVSAATACSAEFADEDLLRSPTPACDTVGRAPRAARPAVRAEHVRGLPVHRTPRLAARRSSRFPRLAPRVRRGLELVAAQPIADRCRAATQLCRDLANGEIASHESFEVCLAQRATGRVLLRVH